MPNYNNAKIYKLTSTKSGRVYIGSTTLTLKKRLTCHRANYVQYKKGKQPYKTSFEVIKKDPSAIRITLLENCPCKNQSQVTNRERAHIKKWKSCVNKNLK